MSIQVEVAQYDWDVKHGNEHPNPEFLAFEANTPGYKWGATVLNVNYEDETVLCETAVLQIEKTLAFDEIAFISRRCFYRLLDSEIRVRRDMRRRGWPRTSQGFNAHYHVYFQEDEDAGWVETPIRNLNMPGDTSDDTGGSSTDTADRTSSDEEYSNA